ncbi:MAG: CoA pyrophosphatase [Proteobacteria bacterium]|nr:CoA pyrophosphatase [Pseudomonadota bacterium]
MLMAPQTASAAVAIIQCHHPRDSYLILRRAAHPDDPWSGHFSFPGGRKDQADEDLLATCIRETAEETGILLSIDQLQQRLVLEPAGRLLKHPIWVQPFLFTLPKPPPLRLDPKEIQGALWLDAELFQTASLHQNVELLPGCLCPAYPVEDYYLWGFTYRLLRSILKMDQANMELTLSGHKI